MEKKIVTGLAGYGLSGRYFHAPFLASNSSFYTAAVFERTKEESKSDFPEAQIVRSFDELVSIDELELIVISTPNETHFPYVKKALEKGKHVVVEKPFTCTVSEADELISIASKTGKILTVYHNRRYDGDFMTVCKVIEDGSLGRIVEFDSAISRYRKGTPFRGWKAVKQPGAGILFDLGPHLIDQALLLFGFPDSVWAGLNYDHKGSEFDDGFTIFMQYEEMRVLLRSGTMIKDGNPRFAVHGENGSYVKYGFDIQEELLKTGVRPLHAGWAVEDDSGNGILTVEINGIDEKRRIKTVPGNYQLFYDDLADAVRSGKNPAVTPQQARNVIAVIEAAHRSAAEKRNIMRGEIGFI
ncbi:MAG: Gfo/Idh/MocA family oxidoreductase [Spirochaetes bacterium]|nr:Gfo/Idh/MocA family oxidoreductase [Spirochaetota bacterium]